MSTMPEHREGNLDKGLLSYMRLKRLRGVVETIKKYSVYPRMYCKWGESYDIFRPDNSTPHYI
jgi:hypothetical protein